MIQLWFDLVYLGNLLLFVKIFVYRNRLELVSLGYKYQLYATLRDWNTSNKQSFIIPLQFTF